MAEHDQILLLRHGQTDWNLEGRLQGRSDIPLNEAGIAGAYEAAHALDGQRFAGIFSSPLTRALQTAMIVSACLGAKVSPDMRLIERDFGALEGQLHSHIRRDHGLGDGFATSDDLPSGAESWAQIQTRTLAAFRDAEKCEGPVLIVSHLAALTALAEALGYCPPVFSNSTPVTLSSLPIRAMLN